jgi:hypothetical protein
MDYMKITKLSKIRGLGGKLGDIDVVNSDGLRSGRAFFRKLDNMLVFLISGWMLLSSSVVSFQFQLG